MPFDYTGSFSGSFTGDLTSTNGVVSSSAQVNYSQIQNKPTTITPFQANQIAANTYFRENASGSISTRLTGLEAFSSSFVDNTGSDAQTLTLTGFNLSISDGNTVNLAALAAGAGAGGSSIWSTGSQDPSTFEYRETSNNLQVTGSLRVSGGITGSLFGTSDTASYIDPTFLSSSMVELGFGSLDTSSLVTNDTFNSFTSSQEITNANVNDDINILYDTKLNTSSFNSFTSSIQGQVDSLMADTSSYSLITDLTTVSSSVESRLTSLEGGVTEGVIFAQTGSVYATTNDLEITGSLTITDGVLRLSELTTTPTAEEGAIYYSASNYYFGM